MQENIIPWLGFSTSQVIGPKTFQKLINQFPSLQEAWDADYAELKEAGLSQKALEKFFYFKKTFQPNKLFNFINSNKIELIKITDQEYPFLLKQISNPPFLLYLKGNKQILNSKLNLAIVGTRKITKYGLRVAQEIIPNLTSNNIQIVSGLALGIDTQAHIATLNSNGKTIAVLGSGLDNIYPRTNTFLSQKIIEQGGAVISEFPIGSPVYKTNFPQRNRIISGLSFGTLVIEAGERSGALITAFNALEQNREVFAVPGEIFYPQSAGPLKLINLGAKIVRSANDILENFDLKNNNTQHPNQIIPANQKEALIIKILRENQPLSADKIIEKLGLNTAEINMLLSSMEISEKVVNIGNNQYQLNTQV